VQVSVGVEDHGVPRDGSDRVLRAALIASLLVHVLGFFLYAVASHRLSALRTAYAIPTPPPDAIVTISNAIRIERRARPRPVERPRPQERPAQRQPPPQPQQRVAVAQPPAPEPQRIVLPSAQPKTRALHELAKTVPGSVPNPPRTIHATPPPQPNSKEAPRERKPQRVAYERPQPRSARSAQLTEERIARMNEEFGRALSQLRQQNDPLAVRPEPPAAPKQYKMQMLGVGGDLHHGEGYYYPIKEWRADGYDYYYVSYEFTWADGTYETGGVPWPIRFRPHEDPFRYPDRLPLRHVPLPAPLPGWTLPPGEHVGKALLRYLPDQSQTQG
jgi:hypothetical protein